MPLLVRKLLAFLLEPLRVRGLLRVPLLAEEALR
jgi:hypothetical protein